MLFGSNPPHTSIFSPTMEDQSQPASSRILYDIPCRVCTDHSSGKHYGIFACDGCAGFFKRSIRRNRQYVCKAKIEGNCVVDKTHRNQCRSCRLKRCIMVGMNREAVQHERGPRNSTLRRQMTIFFKEKYQESPSIEKSMQVSISPTTSVGPVSSAFKTDLSSPISGRQGNHALLIPQHLRIPPFHPRLLPSHLAHFHSNVQHQETSIPRYIFDSQVPSLTNVTNQGANLDCLPETQSVTQTLESMRDNPATWDASEIAARLVFMNVRWTKHVPAFRTLPERDQLTLLEESWRELFVLSAAQFSLPIDICGRDNEPLKTEDLDEVITFKDIIRSFHAINVDPTEYACLRAIVLFKTQIEKSFPTGTMDSPGKRLYDIEGIIQLQDQAQLTLSKYIANQYPLQLSRFGKLLLLLPGLRSISSSRIEIMFFRKTIGNIPLEKIICDMFKTGNSTN